MIDYSFEFTLPSPAEQAAIFDRCQEQTLTWRDYLILLKMLPECTRLKSSFVPGTEDEIEEYGRLLWLQTSLAAWLDYLVTKSQAQNPEEVPIPSNLANSGKVVVEVRAKLSKAVLDLARYTFDHVPPLKTAMRPTPESLWFAWEMQSFENMVFDSGLITGQAKERESKETVAARCWMLANVLETANPITLPLSLVEEGSTNKLLGELEALIGFAYAEAVNDIHFRNSKAYTNFLRALRAWGRECRKNSFWTLTQFENGKRLPIGRKAKREPNRVISNIVTKSLQRST